MKLSSIILLLLAAAPASAQFAEIDDPDGFVYVRETPEAGRNIIDTLHKQDYFFCLEGDGDWIMADYTKDGNARSGYIHSSRIKQLAKHLSLPQLPAKPNEIEFEMDSININIQTEAFDVVKNKLKYQQESETRYIIAINGKQYYGTDGAQPKKQYRSIRAEIGSHTINVPDSALTDLFEPNLHSFDVRYDGFNNRLFIIGSGGDAGGGYEILWVIEKGKYLRREVSLGF